MKSNIDMINESHSIIKKSFNNCEELKKPSYLLSFADFVRSSPSTYMLFVMTLITTFILFKIVLFTLIIGVFIGLMNFGIISLWKVFIIDNLPNDIYSQLLNKNKRDLAPSLIYSTYHFLKDSNIEVLERLKTILQTNNIDHLIAMEKKEKKKQESKFGMTRIFVKTFWVFVGIATIISAFSLFVPTEMVEAINYESKIQILPILVFFIIIFLFMIILFISMILTVKNSSSGYYVTLKYFKRTYQNDPQNLINLINIRLKDSVHDPSLFDFGNKD